MEKRLQSVLSHAGIASRRGVISVIEAGKVKVDGKVIKEKGFRVDPEISQITVDGTPLRKEEKKYYFLLNKPKGVVSTSSDKHAKRTILDYFKHVNVRLYSIGRLDKETTGLIIITNDGDLTHKLSHPSFEISKEYLATLKDEPLEEDLERLEKGIKLYDKVTSPCRIRPLKSSGKKNIYRIKIHEGMKRQIREMFKSIGAEVLELIRVKYASLDIRGLSEGEFRELSESEIKKLKNLVDNESGR